MAPATGHTIGEALDVFVRDHSVRHWSARYEQVITTHLRLFIEHVGGPQVDLGAIEKSQVIAFREKLRERGLAEATVGKYMRNVGALLAFMVAYEWIERNVAENLSGGLAQKEARRPDQMRKAASDADMRAILGCEEFQTLRDSVKPLDRERFWSLLLLAYTGARRGEVAQAWIEDVGFAVDGVPCIRIAPSSDSNAARKSVKTKYSDRVVPIHSDLVELGLLDWVAAQDGGPRARLFPVLMAYSTGQQASKLFDRLRDQNGADRGITLYSLRHRFATQLKYAEVGEPILDELMGHERKSLAMSRYGKRYEAGKLVDAVERLANREPLRALFDAVRR